MSILTQVVITINPEGTDRRKPWSIKFNRWFKSPERVCKDIWTTGFSIGEVWYSPLEISCVRAWNMRVDCVVDDPSIYS
jgi:hypothetical protein